MGEISLFGMDIENWEVKAALYIMSVVGMFFLFKFWISKAPTLSGTYWTYFIIVVIMGLPAAHFIIDHYANK